MNKRLAVIPLSAAALGSMMFMGQDQAVAQEVPATPAIANSASVAATGNYYTTVNYNQPAYTATWIQQVRDLRAQMWDSNVPYQSFQHRGSTIQEVATSAGYTRDTYINALVWDGGMEDEAMTRAAEQYARMGHTRPNGAEPGSPVRTDIAGDRGENLLQGDTPLNAIAWWSTKNLPGKNFSELDDLIANKGMFSYYNGHLYALLNPDFKSFGMAAVTNANGAAPHTVMRLNSIAPTATTYVGTAGTVDVALDIATPPTFIATANKTTVDVNGTGTARVMGTGSSYNIRPYGAWVSSNPSALSVNAATGEYVGLAAGNHTLTFVANNGTSYSVGVTVNAPVVKPTPEPVEPEVPVVPEEPITPEQPVEPVEPEVPVEPVAPEEPVTPEQPVEPVNPEVPVEPEQPVVPEEPVTPEQPVDPEVPVEPVNPEVPVEPEQPVVPEEPVTPEQPVDPVAPEEPVVPEQPTEPVTPEEPVAPEEPVTPAEPEQPVAPEEPVVPEQPTEPEAPVTPDVPEVPAPQEPVAPVEQEALTQPQAPATEQPVNREKAEAPAQEQKPADQAPAVEQKAAEGMGDAKGEEQKSEDKKTQEQAPKELAYTGFSTPALAAGAAMVLAGLTALSFSRKRREA